MKEKLEVYDLDSNLISIQNRDDFYSEIKKEFKEKGKISKKVKTVRILLMNSMGRVYLQKRSDLKEENSELYDKTVGGHVAEGDSFNMTAVRECAEELGFPVSILPDDEFNKSIMVVDLSIIGIFKKIDYIDNFQSVRINRDGSHFIQPIMSNFYIGYYDGAIKFIDGESSGVEAFSLDKLEEEIKNNPDKFTEDIKFMIEKYRDHIKPIK